MATANSGFNYVKKPDGKRKNNPQSATSKKPAYSTR
jgi:hypothetical protein